MDDLQKKIQDNVDGLSEFVAKLESKVNKLDDGGIKFIERMEALEVEIRKYREESLKSLEVCKQDIDVLLRNVANFKTHSKQLSDTGSASITHKEMKNLNKRSDELRKLCNSQMLKTFEFPHLRLEKMTIQQSLSSIGGERKSVNSNEEFYFFSSPGSPLHPLHKHEFEVGGVKYNSIQQYVDRQKMEQSDVRKRPKGELRDSTKLKKSPVNDPLAIQKVQKEDTKRAYIERSMQCKSLHDLLCKTKGQLLVYANETDHILGIGMLWNNPLARQRDKWNGQNLLGEWLKEVQEEITRYDLRFGSNARKKKKQETNVAGAQTSSENRPRKTVAENREVKPTPGGADWNGGDADEEVVSDWESNAFSED